MKNQFTKRLLSLLLVAAFVLGFATPISANQVSATGNVSWKESDLEVTADLSDRAAAETQETSLYADTDMVRVSIVLDEKSTMQAGFSTMNITQNAEAMAYNAQLQAKQEVMVQTISTQALGGEKLDVVWNMTLVGNIISANVAYGKIEAIESVAGVKSVCIEQRHEPDVVSKEETASPERYTSGEMVGSRVVWSNGYTGAGSRIAIIDTGTDTDHQSFDHGAYLYALRQNAKDKGVSYEEYVSGLDLLDKAEITGVLKNLNVYERNGALTTDDLFLNDKLAFTYNYIDNDLDVTHDNDGQGEHGSHVAGIATANRYIPQGDSYVDALENVFVAGVAPDAQLLTMKVFGKGGGAYDSDYMAAIEDAILLGADSVNLSLNSVAPGFSYTTTYGLLLEELEESDTVMVNSAGNSSYWAKNSQSSAAGAYLYNDDVNFATGGSPGSYSASLAVASVDNDGGVGNYFAVGDKKIIYTEGTSANNAALTTLDTSAEGTGTVYDYIFVDGVGQASDFEGIDLTGKVVFCSRGTTSFYQKANEAVSRGAVATVVYNNQSGTIAMNMAGYSYTAPAVSILQAEGAAVKAMSTQKTTEAGLTYYTGKITIAGNFGTVIKNSEYYTMSSFSSWGVPGSLEMKPEITAPGGSIYSVYGSTPSGGGSDQYEVMSGTSMAAPQVAGMVALVAQYLRESGIDGVNGLSTRDLATSLLMSTAVPMVEEASGNWYSLLNQGSGLARVDLATSAESYVLIGGRDDGKVKVELGDDPERTGNYNFSFTINNLNGEEMVYALDADVFTQDVFEAPGMGTGINTLFLDTWTKDLPLDFVFTVDGETVYETGTRVDCDLNGDGVTDALDADYLVEYLLGNETELFADGDVSGDSQVNTYDAHILLALTAGKSCVTVPANGSVTVEANLTLTDEVKAYLDTYYPNGAYIEAYIFAEAVADEEGNVGVSHSIPVLGFYGGWTESSMFDKLSFIESAYKMNDQYAYLQGYAYIIGGSIQIAGDYLTVDYGDGTEYYWGGNPVGFREDTYLPQRNALNNETSRLVNYGNTLIRNAADSKLVITNAETGEIYHELELGQRTGAYYYTNGASWQNYTFNQELEWNGTDAQGNKLPEGTTVELSYVAAPDYYVTMEDTVDANGNPAKTTTTNWDALGEGAYDTVQFTIDNTAPEVSSIVMDVMSGSGLLVTAKDNQYVSAVVMMNAKGTSILAMGYANQTEANTDVTVELDVSGISGDKFLIVAYDYAMNANVYEIELGLSSEKPYFTALQYNYNGNHDWIGFDTEGDATVLGSLTGERMLAAEYVDGYVFMVGSSYPYNLYVAPDDDIGDIKKIGSLGVWTQDIAYNKADGKLYALYYKFSYTTFKNSVTIGEIDMYNGTLTDIASYPYESLEYSLETPQILGMAIDGAGNFYGVQYNSKSSSDRKSDFFTFTLDTFPTMTYIGSDPLYGSFPTQLAWDHNTNELYGIFNFETDWLAKVDTETGKVTKVREVTPLLTEKNSALCGLFIRPVEGGGKFAPTDKVNSFALSATTEQTFVGNTVQLSATIKPWNISDETVLWTSSDESIATVDENGVVYGVSAGTVTITGAPKVDPTFTASCTVTVKELDLDMNAVIWDENGEVWWSEFNTKTIPNYTKLTEKASSEKFAAVTQLSDGTVYAATLNTSSLLSDLYKVDAKTLDATKIGGSSSVGYFDMAYAPNVGEGGTLLAVYGPYVLLVDTNNGEYTGAWQWLDKGNLVSIAYAKSQQQYVFDSAWNMYQVWVDYFYLVDANGNVYYDYFYVLNDSYYHGYTASSALKTNMGYKSDSLYFSSAHYDATSKMLVWAAFNEGNDNVKLMAFDSTKNRGYSVGTFADGVWPVAGLTVLNRGTAEGGNAVDETKPTGAGLTTVDIAEVEAYAASLRAQNTTDATAKTESVSLKDSVSAMSGSIVDEETKTLTINVTPTADSTNGRITVSFDASDLTFVSGTGLTEAFGVTAGEGEVEIGYASANDLTAGTDVATLTFAYDAICETKLTITQTELNNESADLMENLTIALPHEYQTVVIEPTCTEEGYTTYICIGCGESYTADYTDPVGHSFGDWTIVEEPTCFTEGLAVRTCTVCGENEYRSVEVNNDNCPAEQYDDLNPAEWYHEGIDYVLRRGLMNGMGNGKFAPGAEMTRAQLVTVLYRMAGAPETELTGKFSDVPEDAWYAEAVAWAYANGITEGMTETLFVPNASVTREQMVTFFARYAANTGNYGTVEGDLSDFTDAADVSAYAMDAMAWAVNVGLIEGVQEGILAPKGTATRAQVATILMRYCETFGE